MKGLSLLALLWVASAAGVSAAPLCTSFGTLTAADLQALGSAGCQFGDKIFSNFTYVYRLQDASGTTIPGDGGTPAVGASSVRVLFSNLGGDPMRPILSLLGTWQASDGNTTDISVTYDVTSSPSLPMYYSWMSVTGQVSNTDPANDIHSYISAADTITTDGSSVNFGFDLFAPPTITPLSPYIGSSSMSYAPTTTMKVEKDILITSGTGANQAVVTRVDQGIFERTETVPEPATAYLMGGAMAVLGMVRIRLRKA